MFRILVGVTAIVFGIVPVAAEEPKPKPTVELSGSIDDAALRVAMPDNGVIASQKAWDRLAKTWSIKDAPKLDFAKEILIVGTWRGSSFDITPVIKDGDLTIRAAGTKDLTPGFRWKIASVKRDGIKTVNGKDLPKE